MAAEKRTRPAYELWGVSREQVEKDYPDFVKSGWVGTAKQEGSTIQTVLMAFGFDLQPNSGWERIGYEVRLIALSMTGLLPESKGNARLARECRQLASKIDRIAFAVSDLSEWQAVALASFSTKNNVAEHISSFFTTARRLERIGEFLESAKQPTKWATTRRREARLVLACKLAPLIEQEFGMPAKPRGGSEACHDIRDENDWTKFFQGISKLVIGETETPDRQQILWEAAKPSEIPDQSSTAFPDSGAVLVGLRLCISKDIRRCPLERLLTIREFCERNGIGRSTVYRENAAGRLPVRKIGRAVRIAESDAKGWQEDLLVSGRAKPSL